ncbi:MAG: hypothetical protein GKR89_15440 [Candidatus Latescibacteria bacterium]|nr:hypothetical protein [Candidatus Latescibacterota bacterium]
MTEINLPGKVSDFNDIGLKRATRGDLDAVLSLLRQRPNWLSKIGPHGRTMLWEAAHAGREQLVELLLDRGAPLEHPGCYYTPMLAEVSSCTAAHLKGHDGVVRLLQQHGAGRDFHDACYLGDQAYVTDALSRDASLVQSCKSDTSDEAASTPLFYAVAGCQSAILIRLLETWQGPLPGDGGLLLRWAVWRDDEALIAPLLEHGAHPQATGLTNWATQPHLRQLARRHGHEPDIDAPNWLGFPALVDACRGNHNQTDDPDRAQALLDLGAAVNIRDHKGKTPLHRAAQAGFSKIPALLLQRGADLEAPDAVGETPLFEAVRAGRPAAVALLLAAGADPHRANSKGRTCADLARGLKGAKATRLAEVLDQLLSASNAR